MHNYNVVSKSILRYAICGLHFDSVNCIKLPLRVMLYCWPGNSKEIASGLLDVSVIYDSINEPNQMFRSIIYNKDFKVSLEYESDDFLPPRISSLAFAHYAVSGLTDAIEKYASRNFSALVKANLHFSLSRSGILSLDGVDAIIEITDWLSTKEYDSGQLDLCLC
ncbi:hypothetical protein FXO38_30976 [Capsicum annuum]|uniref:Uncharacterized protein n=1 Tax=Capsicum annuum TaxID=4072 RepID=A0A2G3AMZ9_CAPAN|nr:hypothetical protein FXO38_30976 [Capsicum annuum]KAF3680147.1 hypothetical protein FXO37_03473 [Capsicum annuum]PHT95612.1 hypothetical protein T459_03494 [Capsicum annuum]